MSCEREEGDKPPTGGNASGPGPLINGKNGVHAHALVPQDGQMEPEVAASSSTATSIATKPASGIADSSKAKTEGKTAATNKKPKKDRSKLRKGKWTVEEEEYTSRIIHYFSTGLLTLPEGATLRSYLADKLNCDPMRITKKYAGASCLGRRVYHFRDRVHPTIAEIQVAKAELDHLEQRFRLRIEGGSSTGATSAASLPSPVDIMSSFATAQSAAAAAAAASNPLVTASLLQQQQQPPGAPGASFNPIQSLLLGLAAQQNAAAPVATNPLLTAMAAAPGPTSVPSFAFPGMLQMPQANASPAPGGLPPALTQLLLQNAAGRQTVGATPSPTDNTSTSTNQIPGSMESTLAYWAFTQAAASLGPAFSQLAAANLQQVQAQVQGKAPTPAASALPQQPQVNTPFSQMQLQTQLQDQQAKLQQKLSELQQTPAPAAGLTPTLTAAQLMAHVQASGAAPAAPAPSTRKTANTSDDQASNFAHQLKQAYDLHVKTQSHVAAPAMAQSLPEKPSPASVAAPASAILGNPDSNRSRSEEDKAAGTALLGFLSSLRQSYEDALREKQQTVVGTPSPANVPPIWHDPSRGATVTDSSNSNQPESSVEDLDWNSDKKTEPSSSSEDSDKEGNEGEKQRGPPRKRIRTVKSDQ